MNRCETCKHFSDRVYGDRKVASDGVGTCDSLKLLTGYGIKFEEIPQTGAMIESDEGLGIYVAAQFGCVNHEPNTKCSRCGDRKAVRIPTDHGEWDDIPCPDCNPHDMFGNPLQQETQ